MEPETGVVASSRLPSNGSKISGLNRGAQRGRAGGHRIPLTGPIGEAASRDAIGLGLVLDCIQHVQGIGAPEVECFPGGIQRKAELRLVEGNETARRNGGTVGNAEFISVGIIAQISTGEICAGVGVIVELDELGTGS